MTNLNNEFRPTCACGEEMKLVTHANGQSFVCECPLGFGVDVNLCTDCTKIIPADLVLCQECSDVRREAHMKYLQKQADKYFEGKSKEEAIEGLCRYANSQCLAMFDTWIYKYGVEKYGITRGDYYNDYDELTEEAKRFIGDNWKANTGTREERLARLEVDLKRELAGLQNGGEHVMRDIESKRYTSINHYARHFELVGLLIAAVKELAPRSGGRYVWEI